ncbi:MAG: glycosyltransferase family A protein [Gammaproteobacteria bacterium]|nr:glycosyltransferase family A protein [Gammaproteobacteria bacterium]
MSGANITAIINGHNEGLLAHSSLKSLAESVRLAEKRGLSVQVNAILDRPDALTLEVFESFAKNFPIQITVVDYADSGLSRNAGVQGAKGKWIAFLDADDIWGSNWLWAAHQSAERDTRAVIWHPEVNVYIGSVPHLFLHVDMDGEKYDQTFLAYTNYWTALCFVERNIVAKIPYSPTQMDSQIGHEDWSWNMETIANGVIHKVVPETAHVIRVKNVSVVKKASAAGCLPRPSNMFRQMLAGRVVTNFGS